MNNRTNSLYWWNKDLVKFEQFELCEKYYKGRKPNTLTGREIEKIWKSETVAFSKAF